MFNFTEEFVMAEGIKTTKAEPKKPRKPKIESYEDMTPREKKQFDKKMESLENMTPAEKEKFEAERAKIEASIRRGMHGLPTKEEWMEQHKPKVEVLKVRVGGCSKRRFHKVCKHTYFVPLNESELYERFNRAFNPTVMIGMRTSDLMRTPPVVKEIVEYSCDLCNCSIPRYKAEPELLNFVPEDSCFY